jgi:hypothetical protein
MARRGEKSRKDGSNESRSALVLSTPAVGQRGADSSESAREQRARQMLAIHNLNLVWLQIRSQWSWLVVISPDRDFSTADIAYSLSVVGSRLSGRAVDFIDAKDVDLDSSSGLIAQLGTNVGAPEAWDEGTARGPDWTRPDTKAIVALESPVANPLALPVALAADGVILCVHRRRTSMSAIRDVVDAVGADRILCAVMLDE